MPFDLATIGSTLGIVQGGLDVASKYAPAAGEAARKVTRNAFASIRASHVSNGEHHLYPRAVGKVTWEMVALSDTSLLNLSTEPADIEAFEAGVDGGGRAVFWTPGVVLTTPPPEAGSYAAHGLMLGGPTAMLQVHSRLFALREGFPLVIPPRQERRVQLAFLVDRLVTKDEGITLRLRCRQRGQKWFRPVAGPLRFDAAGPIHGTKVEYDPITRYPIWIDGNSGAWSGTI